MEASSEIKSVTATAPVNIAVIKYWGKRDEELILPVNGSISATLSQSHLRAKTTVAVCPSFERDRLWLNAQEKSLENDARLQNVLREIRRRARKRRRSSDESINPMLAWKVHICSENNFPTAAGLASSAAGFACLVFALAKLYGVTGEISEIARRGSGSACRSIYGGFVEWVVGTKDDGSDSIARQIASENHWPQMSILLLIVSADKKQTSSSHGMQKTVETSQLLKYRAEELVPSALRQMKEAIKDRDFHRFAELTMKDSNQMHAVCLDTSPPITYLTDTSRDVMRLVSAVNDFYGENKVAYTFDAGPNACLYLLDEMVPLVLSLIRHFFPPVDNGTDFLTGIQLTIPPPDEEVLSSLSLTPRSSGAIKYVIHTKVGSGPVVIDDPSASLLNSAGFPLDQI